ncbi:MAG: RdgB/HAM1 family non-canonical purine NTP pyrophosphatase [archaeon]|jgi:non-canonical purine NTP pyrophosphatase (RdgB/HAM1 family)
MVLYFITGNKHKLEEFNQILFPEIKVEQLNIDLDEIQSTDPMEVIKHKLLEAQKHHKGELLVEDTSLYLDALNGFPGPLIKWFLNSVGREGIYQITQKLNNSNCFAKTMVGYYNGKEILFFEGIVKGKIVAPKSESEFGWDPLFMPEGKNQSFAEMSKEEKNSISHRKRALEKFKEYYLSKK